MTDAVAEPIVYQGQFGDFVVTDHDRHEVQIYRAGLILAAVSFAIGVGLALWQPTNLKVLPWITVCYNLFALGLGISLWTIHIYLRPLHQALQVFWVIGAIAAFMFGHSNAEPFARTIYFNPLTILGVGFTFAALTGVYFKEAFCFNRLETKLLTPLVPVLLLGHLTGFLSLSVERTLLAVWAVLFLVFALRKLTQPLPSDIGDKSVFEYLRQQRQVTQP